MSDPSSPYHLYLPSEQKQFARIEKSQIKESRQDSFSKKVMHAKIPSRFNMRMNLLKKQFGLSHCCQVGFPFLTFHILIEKL
jgi:hypothetical protein